MNIETIYKPSYLQLEFIKKYLISEQKTGNLLSIINSFERNELIVLYRDNELVGFSAYEFNYPVSKINVVEIIKKYRNSGLGEKIANTTLSEIKKKKGEVVELLCSPPTSESFWKKIGFKNMPETKYNTGQIIMYKTLIKILLPNKTIENKEVIELWNVEPHQAHRNEPKWRWNINSLKLETPIIHPTDSDWQICWRKGDLEIKKGKVKYFSSNQIQFENLLIIRNLLNIKNKAHE